MAAPQFDKYRSLTREIIKVDYNDIPLEDPPKDDSHTTRMELEELLGVAEEAKLPRKLLDVSNGDPLRLFVSVAKNNKLDPLESEAKRHADEWTALSFELKDKFQRRRPWEVKKEHEVDLVSHQSDTTESPSYPSGHAMMGYGVAEFYKSKYPYLDEQWDNIADIIAHSRLQMGVHYPSDVKASKKVVDWVVSNEKTSSQRRRTTIFGVDPEGKLLHGFGGQGFYKFPGGGVDPGESITDAAKRELLEEAGYSVDSIEELPGLDTSDSVGAGSAKGHMGHGSSLTKYLLARLGQRDESLLGSEGDAISSLQTAPIDEVLQGLEGDMLFGSGVAESNHAALTKLKGMLNKTAADNHVETRRKQRAKYLDPKDLKDFESRVKKTKDLPDGANYITLPHGRKAVVRTDGGKSHLATILGPAMRPPGRDISSMLKEASYANLLTRLSPEAKAAFRQWRGRGKNQKNWVKDFSSWLGESGQTGEQVFRTGADARRYGKMNTRAYQDYVNWSTANSPGATVNQWRTSNKLNYGQIGRNKPRPKPQAVTTPANTTPQAKAPTPEPVVEPTVQSPTTTQPTTKGMPSEPGFMKSTWSSLKQTVQNNLGKSAIGAGLAGFGGYKGVQKFRSQAAKPYQPNKFKSNFNVRTASDLSVLTAVPKQNLDLIMRKGLYSQKAMLDDPEVMAAFLAQRNADKAWKNDEQYDEKRFREQYGKRVELMEGNDAPLAGPSVFFTEPDPDKVSDPRHFVNKFDTQKLRVNLGRLLADIPETRITGAELLPSSAAENMSDEEFEKYVKDRRRDITPEEAAKYIATDPKELWKHYKDEYLGRHYAADVPHAFIRTPSGIIPPEYLEQVEKTSSAKEQLKHILKKKAALGDEFQPDLTPDALKSLGVYDQVYGDAPSEASMKEWPEHWINKQDPLGWLQWYDRYSGGRRTDDDDRQMKRWKSFKARHLAQYLKKPTPRRAAALRNWGVDVEKY